VLLGEMNVVERAVKEMADSVNNSSITPKPSR
jgi:hypothetical protein